MDDPRADEYERLKREVGGSGFMISSAVYIRIPEVTPRPMLVPQHLPRRLVGYSCLLVLTRNT